jgi:hypothetical protein
VPGDRFAAEVPNLATSVDNLANRLGAAGQRAERLTAAQEAVDLYEELASTEPELYVHAGGSRRELPAG